MNTTLIIPLVEVLNVNVTSVPHGDLVVDVEEFELELRS